MKVLGAFFCTVFLLVLPALADDTSSANRVLVETVKLLQSAERTLSVDAKLGRLETVQHNLRTIIDHHPSSDLAVKLITGQAIGNISLESVGRVIEDAKEACLTSPNSGIRR